MGIIKRFIKSITPPVVYKCAHMIKQIFINKVLLSEPVLNPTSGKSCEVCGSYADRFIPVTEYSFLYPETLNRFECFCPVCGACDRERLYALYIKKYFAQVLPYKDYFFLDIAPNPSLTKYIEFHYSIDYRTMDIHKQDVTYNDDITNITSIGANEVDFLLCSHVLEHVDDDKKALLNIYRIMKPNARGIIMVPIDLAAKETDEDLYADENERLIRFGQKNHVRKYAKDDFIERMQNAGFFVRQLGMDYFGMKDYYTNALTQTSTLYLVEKPGIDGKIIGNILNGDLFDLSSSDKPLVHSDILEFLDNNLELLSGGRFVILPNNDNAQQLQYALKAKQLYDSDRFRLIDVKNKWSGGAEIQIGNFGDYTDYDNVTIIYGGNHRGLDEFLFWNRSIDSRKIMFLRTNVINGGKTYQKVLSYDYQSVLDIGCGYGMYSKFFADRGCGVTGITYPESGEGRYTGEIIKDDKRVEFIIGDYLSCELNRKFDLVWASHVMEHVDNMMLFIRKIKENVNKGGVIAITVPNGEVYPSLNHVHRFNAGYILRNLVYAGIDCRNAKILDLDYQLSVIIPNVSFFAWNSLKEIFDYLPSAIERLETEDGGIVFNGNIIKLNWDKSEEYDCL